MDYAILFKEFGIPGLAIFSLGYVIWKYLLPVILKVGETNEKQAESLVKVSENLLKISNDVKEIPDHIHAAKNEIIDAVKYHHQKAKE